MANPQPAAASVMLPRSELGKGMKNVLPRALQTLRRLGVRAPPRARQPPPSAVVAFAANVPWREGRFEFALSLLWAFVLYFRPSVPLTIRAVDLVAGRVTERALVRYDVIPHPYVNGGPS